MPIAAWCCCHHPACRLEPTVEVHRSDQGFGGIGEDRGLVPSPAGVLAPPEPQRRSHVDPSGRFGQRRLVDQLGPGTGQATLGLFAAAPIQRIGDDQPEHRVAEKLQAFVRLGQLLLGERRAVHQSQTKQLNVGKVVAQPLGQGSGCALLITIRSTAAHGAGSLRDGGAQDPIRAMT